MHRRSEYGVAAAAWAAPLEAPRAAPFATKGGRGDAAAAAAARAAAAAPPTPPSLLAARRNSWLAAIREWQAEFVGSLTAQEFVDCVTGDLLASARVFAFTPAGDVVRLPRGATVVDFAYHVHTDVGNEMIGARVNGAPAPADRPLHNADVVDVVTQSGPPTRLQLATHDAWLKHARTRSARHKLARFLREHGWPPPDEAQARDRVAREARARGRDREAREAADAGATLADPRSAPPPPPHVAWLTVECVDRAGLLADVSAAMAKAKIPRVASNVAPPCSSISFRRD
jgi:(p)ppGpp synthase/HD superfamily hydrolase